ncbi:nuclear transport factor 2 family protein [Catenulispora yoronensis]
MKTFQKYLAYDEVRNVTVHETADPQVVVVEFTLAGRLVPTGQTFELTSVNVIRVVDGLIAESRDYSDGRRVAALFEQIQAVDA